MLTQYELFILSYFAMGVNDCFGDIDIQTTQMTDNGKNPFLDKQYRESVWNRIVAEIEEKEKVKKIPRSWIRYAAAILVIVTGAFLVFIAGGKKNRAVPVTASYVRIINPIAKIYKVAMEDGSKVSLYPNSEVVYRKPFGGSDRKITLKGKAFFEVAKNKTKPFRVYSNSVVTTAVGTSFTIVSDSLADEVNVFLHSGKVTIEQSGSRSKVVHLTAGQQLSWNIASGSSIVRESLPVIKPLSPVKKLIHKSPEIFTLVFDQEPLPDVLKKIASRFTIPLKYDTEELSSLYFSGTVKSTDKPIRILQRIAVLHDLVITEDKKGYRISKN